MKEGMNEKEARRAAMVEMGGVEQVKEEVRAGRTGFAMETIFQDIRYGLRSLLKKPGFTLTAVIALALGIGANTAIFSVINGVLLRSLSYPNPERIVMLWEKSLTGRSLQNVISPGNFLDWQKQSTSFESMAAVWDLRVNLTGGSGEPEEIKAQLVSQPFFAALGVQPLVGRAFLPQEDKQGNDLVIILSHELWQTRFGSDFFFQAEDGIRDYKVTGVQTCALPIYLGQVLEECTSLFAGAAQAKGIELIVWPPAREHCSLLGDALRVRQILMNLIGNAVKLDRKSVV